jgi:ribose/xylose/arabinose/galactoside ABC-type transport system permease subunit
MMKKFLVTLGVLVVLIGAATLIHPELKMPSHQREIDVQGQKLIINTRRIVTVPAVLSGIAIVVGAAGILAGARKSRMSQSAKPTE